MPPGAWKQWVPAILWLVTIAIESTDLFSSEHTGNVLYSWLTQLFGQINPVAFFILHHYLRKAGHVFGYAILSYLLFRAWRATLPMPNLACWSFQWARTAWFMSALVGGLDEWHQTFIPSRTGTIRDVVLDSVAALGAQIVLWIVLRNKLRKSS